MNYSKLWKTNKKNYFVVPWGSIMSMLIQVMITFPVCKLPLPLNMNRYTTLGLKQTPNDEAQ